LWKILKQDAAHKAKTLEAVMVFFAVVTCFTMLTHLVAPAWVLLGAKAIM
jgi:hypothetical protein